MTEAKRWFIIATNDYSENYDRYRLLIAFHLAVNAQKAGIKVTLGFQGAGVECVQERFMKFEEKVGAKRSVPLPSLAQSFVEFYTAGGRVLVDRLSVEALGAKRKMVDGAEVVESYEFVKEIDAADKVIVY
ncbi:DsrE family protein [candidate division WOR-3 bacterium]|nr:DsrE family protein [candidate division WOR-3 bacterium]